LGLFAKKKIKANKFICQYGGETYEKFLLTTSDVKGDSTYFDPSVNRIVYGTKDSLGCYANDPKDDTKCNCIIKYVHRNKTFEVFALENDIEKEEELYLAYGEDYWQDDNI
jgi:SET domain-containing protein